MHTIDILEEALQLARASGWQVRHEWLGGAQGGACRLGQAHILFVDRSLTAQEQLDQVLSGLRSRLHCSNAADSFSLRFNQCVQACELSVELRRCLALCA